MSAAVSWSLSADCWAAIGSVILPRTATKIVAATARRLVDVQWALLRDGREFTPHKPPPLTAPA
jgi:hypothetical protein